MTDRTNAELAAFEQWWYSDGCYRETAYDAAKEAWNIAAMRQPSEMVLVPRVPTLAMLEAGRISQSFGDEELDLDDMRFKWNAMLDAAEGKP